MSPPDASHDSTAAPVRTPPHSGAWIKVRTNLWDDPRVATLCDLLDKDEASVIGGLVRLWSLADTYSTDGTMPYTPRMLDRRTGIEGFAKATADVGWLIIGSDSISIPNYHDHVSQSAKARAQTASRQARRRGKSLNVTSLASNPSGNVSRSQRDSSVTTSLSDRHQEIELEQESELESDASTRDDELPSALKNLLSLWNALAEEKLVPHKAKTSPPAKAVSKAWSKAQGVPELQTALASIDAIEAAIRGSPFVQPAGWFRVEKLIAGTNKEGTYILTKLLEGGYADHADRPRATHSQQKGKNNANGYGLSPAERTEQANVAALEGFVGTDD